MLTLLLHILPQLLLLLFILLSLLLILHIIVSLNLPFSSLLSSFYSLFSTCSSSSSPSLLSKPPPTYSSPPTPPPTHYPPPFCLYSLSWFRSSPPSTKLTPPQYKLNWEINSGHWRIGQPFHVRVFSFHIQLYHSSFPLRLHLSLLLNIFTSIYT